MQFYGTGAVFGVPTRNQRPRNMPAASSSLGVLRAVSLPADVYVNDDTRNDPVADIEPELGAALFPRPPGRNPARGLRDLLVEQQHDEFVPPVPPPRRAKTASSAASNPSATSSTSTRQHRAVNNSVTVLFVGRLGKVPIELCVTIAEFFGYRELIMMSRVSRVWCRACNTDMLWHRVHTAMTQVNTDEFGQPYAAPAEQPRHDPWRTAVGVNINRGSYKVQVKAYVVATRARVIAEVDDAVSDFQRTNDRLETRANTVGRLTAYERGLLNNDVPRLSTVIAKAEEAMRASAAQARELENQQLLAARTVKEAKVSLTSFTSQLRAITLHLEVHASAEKRRLALEAFERRVASLVLAHAPHLPVVLRRGVEGLGAVDLLAAQLPSATALHDAWSKVKVQLGVESGEYWKARAAFLASGSGSLANTGDVFSRHTSRELNSTVALAAYVDLSEAALQSRLGV